MRLIVVALLCWGKVRKLLDKEITPEELERARQRQLRLLLLFVETPDDIANRVCELLREKQHLDWFDAKADRILTVTAHDVMRVAKKYLTHDAYAGVVDGPLEPQALDRLARRALEVH